MALQQCSILFLALAALAYGLPQIDHDAPKPSGTTKGWFPCFFFGECNIEGLRPYSGPGFLPTFTTAEPVYITVTKYHDSIPTVEVIPALTPLVGVSSPLVEVPVFAPQVEAPVIAPQVEVPVVAPQAEVPVVAPQFEVPVIAPQVEAPFITPQFEVPSIAPQVEAPVIAPQVEVPVVAPQVEVPVVAPQFEVPVIAPQVEAPSITPQFEVPSIAPQFEAPIVADYSLSETPDAPHGEVVVSSETIPAEALSAPAVEQAVFSDASNSETLVFGEPSYYVVQYYTEEAPATHATQSVDSPVPTAYVTPNEQSEQYHSPLQTIDLSHLRLWEPSHPSAAPLEMASAESVVLIGEPVMASQKLESVPEEVEKIVWVDEPEVVVEGEPIQFEEFTQEIVWIDGPEDEAGAVEEQTADVKDDLEEIVEIVEPKPITLPEPVEQEASTLENNGEDVSLSKEPAVELEEAPRAFEEVPAEFASFPDIEEVSAIKDASKLNIESISASEGKPANTLQPESEVVEEAASGAEIGSPVKQIPESEASLPILGELKVEEAALPAANEEPVSEARAQEVTAEAPEMVVPMPMLSGETVFEASEVVPLNTETTEVVLPAVDVTALEPIKETIEVPFEPVVPVVEAATEPPASEPIQQMIELPVIEPVQQTTELPVIEPLQQTIEVPVIEPLQQTIEVPVIEPLQQTIEVPVIEPLQQTIEVPVIEPLQQTIEVPVIEPLQQTIEVPTEDTLPNDSLPVQSAPFDSAPLEQGSIIIPEPSYIPEETVHPTEYIVETTNSADQDLLEQLYSQGAFPELENIPKKFEVVVEETRANETPNSYEVAVGDIRTTEQSGEATLDGATDAAEEERHVGSATIISASSTVFGKHGEVLQPIENDFVSGAISEASVVLGEHGEVMQPIGNDFVDAPIYGASYVLAKSGEVLEPIENDFIAAAARGEPKPAVVDVSVASKTSHQQPSVTITKTTMTCTTEYVTYTNECGISYVGCYIDCSGGVDPPPYFEPPACPPKVIEPASPRPARVSVCPECFEVDCDGVNCDAEGDLYEFGIQFEAPDPVRMKGKKKIIVPEAKIKKVGRVVGPGSK